MYTQCPECDVAFRVTAEVLKMAAGQVRCGGCGVAFNALEHLSETKPVSRRRSDPDTPRPTSDEPVELTPDTPPESISAEQSAALLKTLDDLSGGDDIRIEDTGVEWRVVSNEPDESEADDENVSVGEPARTIDDMLFDDNTVLPDDFDAVVEARSEPKVVEPAPVIDPEPPQVDLDLSEPDEWDDLLGDLVEISDDGIAADEDLDLAEPEFDNIPEYADLDLDKTDDRNPEPGDVERGSVEIHAQSGSQATDPRFDEPAESVEIEITGDYDVSDDEYGEEYGDEDADADDDLETSIEEDLFAAAFETEAAAKAGKDSDTGDTESDDVDWGEEDDALPDEVEIDLQPDDDFESEDVEDIAMPFDDKIEETIATLSMSLNEELYREPTAAEDSDDASGEIDGIDAEAEGVDESGQESPSEDGPVLEEPVIPEMSEEEKTINMLIDEELLSIAVEDEDGFASTIVQLQPDDKVEKEIADTDSGKKRRARKGKGKRKDEQPDSGDDDEADGASDTMPVHGMAVETIIMEGEYVRAELGKAALADEDNPADGDDMVMSLNREKDDYERRKELTSHGHGAGMYAAIALLGLLLVAQVVHQSRAELATVPAFNATVGPLYRMLGMPLTPAWNIAGWRFEATKGDTNEAGDVLTIYSRVGNNADEPLPYPLVHVSLTDRFEDVIGSKILEPGDYLPENTDPGQLVTPGDTFNAVISIDSPSPDATGFKLNVCYRLTGDELRCADHNFK